MIRVVLVDDQHLVRAGIRALLERSEDIAVVGEAADGRAGVGVVRAERPDVVLMDLRMPVLDGVAATREVVADPTLAGVHVVVLTTFDADEHVLAAVRAGAVGFLLKDTPPDELRRAVRVVAAGDALLSPSVTRRLLGAVAATRPAARPGRRLDGVTGREREVLAEVARGLSNQEVAAVLSLSPATVRTYVSRLLTKLAARDRSQLVVLGYECGLVVPGSDGGLGDQ